MKTAILTRIEFSDYWTIGHIRIEGKFICLTCEPPWKNNVPNVSCVPEGLYLCVLEYSPRFEKNLYELKNVPDRSEIKFHPISYSDQTNGCIGPMRDFFRLVGQDRILLSKSSNALSAFTKALGYPQNFNLQIENQ